MSGLTVHRIDTNEGFEALEPVWNDLVKKGKHPNIFLLVLTRTFHLLTSVRRRLRFGCTGDNDVD